MNSIYDDIGQERFLGNLDAPLAGLWPVYGDAPARTPMIPRDQWKPCDMGAYLPPVHDQQNVGMCFPAGTLIRMADGTQKPIERVQVLDEVLTAEGNVRRVLRTMVRQEEESLYRLHIWGHRHLRATAEHPILTKRGYVRIADLTAEDMVAMPRYLPASVKTIATADYISGRVYTQRAKPSKYVGIPGKKQVCIVKHSPPDMIHLTPEFGWVVGLYLAEGCTSHGKVTFCLALKEEHTHAAKLVRLVKQSLGIDAHLRTNPAQNTTIVTIHGTQWAKLFEAWCAVGCGHKCLHPDLAAGPRDFLAAVLDGWTDGDGIGDNANGGVTVSHSLAVGMFDVANALGLCPTIETLDVKINPKHNIKSRQRRYIVKWGKFPEKFDKRRELTDTHMYRRVDGVVREEFSGWVFNLEVEGDHSYVAEGVGVHNCNASATVAGMEACRALQGLPYVQLSGGHLYGRINGGTDRGSRLEHGLQAAMSEGVCTTATVRYLDWRSRPAKAKEEALSYRVLEAWLCPTFDHMASALQCGFMVIQGLMWRDNFRIDGDGWLPSRGAGGAGGHALLGYGLAERGGVWGTRTRNSWSAQWGINGNCVIPESLFGTRVGGWWAIRAMVDEGGQVPVKA